jgi:hypothetical protein
MFILKHKPLATQPTLQAKQVGSQPHLYSSECLLPKQGIYSLSSIKSDLTFLF